MKKSAKSVSIFFIFADEKLNKNMATITLKYDGRSSVMRSLISAMIENGAIQENAPKKVVSSYDLTLAALDEIEKNGGVVCESFEEYKKKSSRTRVIVFSSQYKKDLALAIKRKLPINELDNVIKLLAEDKMLPINYLDHPLSGQLKGCRECHIRPNWLLIYRKSTNNGVELLSLIRTGTHDDLFSRVRR